MAFIPVADAIAALRAAGHCVTRTTRADAARRYGCQTALYVIDGRGVNIGRLRQLATLAAEPVAAEPVAPEPVAARPVAADPAPALPGFRRDIAAGRRPAPTGAAMAGQPWDPGTPEARATVALQQERVGILWPIAQALRGEGVALPMAWQHDGPVMSGEWPLARALAALPLGAIAQAAAALAALPPVTGDQAAALSLCRTGCPGPRRPAAL